MEILCCWEGSAAQNAGVELPGITGAATPDCGALEGGNRVLNAGSTVIVPEFLEQTISILNVKFIIAVTSESCPDKNNGYLNVIASVGADYEVAFNGNTYEFTNEKSFENIAPEEYEICINIKGKPESQCFIVNVEEAEAIMLKSSLKSKQFEINVTKGTAPYKVYVNNTQVLETMASFFAVYVNQGDTVKVKTDKDCEGELIQSIDYYSNITPFPNPTSAEFKIHLTNYRRKYSNRHL